MNARYGSRCLWAALLGLVLLCSAFSAGARERRPEKEEPPADPVSPGDPIRGESPKHKQEFWYYVPASCQEGRKAPLVLTYHGAGGNGKAEADMWKKLAEEHGFVLVCPTSPLAGAGKKAGVAQPVNPKEYTDETEAVMSVLEWVSERYPIDKRLVMVTGFSGGGNPAYWLGFLYPDIFPFVCPRCANFPYLMEQAAKTNKEAEKAIRKTAGNSHIYIFWGEKDHPIILGEIDGVLKWVHALNPVHLEEEKIPGLGHNSSPKRAAEWFVAKVEALRAAWKAEAKSAHEKAVKDAEQAKREKDHGAMFAGFSKAAEIEEEYPELESSARRELKRIKFKSEYLLSKAKRALKRTRDENAAKALRETIETWPGTPAAEEARTLLDELNKELKSQEAAGAA